MVNFLVCSSKTIDSSTEIFYMIEEHMIFSDSIRNANRWLVSFITYSLERTFIIFLFICFEIIHKSLVLIITRSILFMKKPSKELKSVVFVILKFAEKSGSFQICTTRRTTHNKYVYVILYCTQQTLNTSWREQIFKGKTQCAFHFYFFNAATRLRGGK